MLCKNLCLPEKKVTSLSCFCPAGPHSIAMMHSSRVWYGSGYPFKGLTYPHSLERELQGGGKKGVVPAMIEHCGKLSFRSEPRPQWQYLPGGEQCLFTVYNRRDRNLISRHIVTPRKCFILSGYIKVTVLSPPPQEGRTKPNAPRQRIPAGVMCSFSKHLFPLPQHGPLAIYFIFQIAAELSRTECQIAGGGLDPVTDRHLIQSGWN